MKQFLLIALVLIAPIVMAQGNYTGSPEVVEQPEPNTDTAVCGDGVCQPEIQGVCPQDCVEGYNESENSTEETSSEQASEGLSVIEIVSGGLTVISGLLLSVLLWNRRSSEEDKTVSDGRNRELEREIRKRLRQGEKLESVREDLMRDGFSQSEIKDAEDYISSELIDKRSNR